MKEQFVILPELPIVGVLKLGTRDGKSLSSIEVVKWTKPSELNDFFKNCFTQLDDFLSGDSKEITIKLDLSALSPFQLSVLKQMKKIPYGEVASYRDLAEKMKSKAFQAIGSACGRNPFLLIYPCHRVVGSKDLGGFAHGLEMKRALLKLEGADLSEVDV
jgi:O-6-methylguanine DNA methyltransferase